MKKYMKILFLFSGAVMFLTSCNKEETLQEYYIKNQENDNFISIDIPRSIITLKDDVPQESKEAFNSIKKLNILAYKETNENKADYKKEKSKLEKILKSKKYDELIRMKHKGANIRVKYIGDDNGIDEMVVYAVDKKRGFAVARVIGEDMKPEKIIKMMKNIDKIDEGGVFSSQIEGIIKGME
ncbi:MAG: DUF4252 domain-containing protein [Flavobacteriia bacterium]|nr:MAG: DUF4252 domain-containing protein [Flavobacteriia bacterium]